MSEQKRTNRSLFMGFFAVALLIGLAGCGADKAFTPTITSGPEPTKVAEVVPTATTVATTAAASAEAVSVILTDYRISTFTAAFKVGATYTFTISNNGAVVHGFTIEPEGATNQPLTNGGQTAAIETINPGESQTLTWTFTEPGTFQIASHLNGDDAKGMVKTGLVVS